MPNDANREAGPVACAEDLETRVSRLEAELLAARRRQKDAESRAAMLESIFQALPTPLFYKNLEGVYLGCNKAFAQVKGIYHTDIIGKTVFDVTTRTRAEDCSGGDEQLKAEQCASISYETTIHPKQGPERDVMFNKALFPGPDGEPAGLVGIISDITEVNRRKNELARLKTKYKVLLETVPHGIVELDVRGHITFSNKAFCRMVGADGVSLEGTLLADLLEEPVTGRDARSCALDFSMENRLPTSLETVVARDGRKIAAQLDWNYKFGKSGEFAGYIVVVTDMTERNLAARKIDQYQKRLRSLSSQLSLVEARERRKIASELHDNLGQDLVLAKFRLKSLLALPTLALRKRRELDSIGRSIDSAIRFARSLTARVSPLILYRLDFESSVEWLAENVLAPCHIACEVRSDELPETFGEDAQVLLFESVRELFVNVVKHAGAGKVKVVIENEDGRVRIRVQDDGKGFPYDPDRSFDDFSGFGLFSIRERIKYLDGDVIISSSAEQGTSVQLVIPPIFLSGGDGL